MSFSLSAFVCLDGEGTHVLFILFLYCSFEELYKGREDISDKKARIEVIAALKEMIRSWLDDNHPEIPAAERLKMAELMDISLIERTKAESLSSLFELNQAVRLSFIEMQFIKKVCLLLFALRCSTLDGAWPYHFFFLLMFLRKWSTHCTRWTT